MLYAEEMKNKPQYKDLWKYVIHTVLLLSHCQAAVEWSFFQNDDVSDPSLCEHNLVALRLVKDLITSVGKLDNVIMTGSTLTNGAAASRRYREYLR